MTGYVPEFRLAGEAHALRPVSYTHLDVYKRQAHQRAGEQQRLACFCCQYPHGLAPVSYTHLDVYKRQAPCRD